MDKGDLEGRRALVTGGGRGIGRAVALALAGAGADVAVAARSAGQVQGVAREIAALGRRSAALEADVTVASSVAAMADAAEEALGGIDILVNNAGGAETALLPRTDRALWERMIAVNLTSVYLCTHRLLPAMKRGGWGRVITIASRAGLTGYPYVSAYCAAKHGAVGFTRAVALEMAGSGVTVNCICPGQADTEMTLRAAEKLAARSGATVEQSLDRLAALNPSGRLVACSEVAAAVLRQASPSSGGVNGEAWEI
ncbi:MAG TPA: SDR family NAD(P)-dependent oxidoreductase [Candidatus Polarisedimenticolia bacterium]|nr:SDR family NAD(P)-dependent oxidoreductase [Candidatus Polarisedimenticolia bacterium]